MPSTDTTFAEGAKRYLAQQFPKRSCCNRAYLAGILLTCRTFWQSGAVTEPSWLVGAVASLSAKGGEGLKWVRDFAQDPSLDGPPFDCEQCRSFFLRGVFLSCGVMSDPAHAYHLELSTPFAAVADRLEAILREIEPLSDIRRCVRKEQQILYYKKASSAEDFLYYIGAIAQGFEMANIRIRKGERNRANRLSNCDTANIEKITSAAHAQLTAIRTLQQRGLLDELPAELRRTAELRLENPEVSLQELAQLHGDRMTKSGVNHRLQRLIAYAKNK